MTAETLRGVLFAIAMGLAPLAAGCASHTPLPDDVARAPTAWSGPPLPLSVGILGVRNRSARRATVIADVVRKSLTHVLRATKLVASAREIGPTVAKSGPPAHLLPEAKDVDILLAIEIDEFALYSSYLWWLLYALLFTIPFAGTVSTITFLLLGGPVASDHAALDLDVTAIEAKTGKAVGHYRGTFEGFQKHTIYARHRVDESFVSHPEIMFQDACGDVVQEMARDRFWLVRFRR